MDQKDKTKDDLIEEIRLLHLMIAEPKLWEKERAHFKEAERKCLNVVQHIIDNSETVIYVADSDGRMLLANKKFLSILGMSSDKVIGHKREDFMTKKNAEYHRNNDLAAIRIRRTITVDEENIEPDGKHYYLAVKFPLLDSHDNVYAVGGICTDITERKKIEEQRDEAIRGAV